MSGSTTEVMFAGLPAEHTPGEESFGTVHLRGRRGEVLIGTFTCQTCSDVGQYAFRGGDVIAPGPTGIVFVASSKVAFRVRTTPENQLEVICGKCESGAPVGVEAAAKPDHFELEFDEDAKEFVVYCQGVEVARAQLPPETVADARMIRFTHVRRQPLISVYMMPVFISDHALMNTPDGGLTDLVAGSIEDGVGLLLECVRTRRAGMRDQMNVRSMIH
jgi:hypothetical protein